MDDKGQKAIELLKKLEWRGTTTDDENWGVLQVACPCCMNSKEQGHKRGCELHACIGC